MKYLKLFEKYKKVKTPKVGDYVIVNANFGAYSKVISQIVGKIIELRFLHTPDNEYEHNLRADEEIVITYNPKDFLFQSDITVDQNRPWSCIVNSNKIEFFSFSKKKCEMYLDSRKYNI